MNRQLRVEVRDSVFDPDLNPETNKKVYWREGSDGSALYKVWLYLAGEDLPYVHSVTYTLHPTFPDPTRRVSRTLTNPNCELVLWTWGMFEVKAAIEDKTGGIYEAVYKLSYDRQLKQEGIEYVREEDAPPAGLQPKFAGYR